MKVNNSQQEIIITTFRLSWYNTCVMGLDEFVSKTKQGAVAFSGGVDSAYLLAEAVRCGADVRAYYVKSAFQPEFERADAREIARQTGADLTELEVDVLSDEAVVSNPPDRCYHCKCRIMSVILDAARKDGYDILCDGSNASDDADDRPGFRALAELGIRSPLRECGITKDEIRAGAKELGLSVWDKPAYACLATRIKSGERITAEKLAATEEAEGILFGMGYRDFRVRMRGGDALVQIRAEQHERAVSEEQKIKAAIGHLYREVSIDEKTR